MSQVALYPLVDDDLVVTPFADDGELLGFLRLPDDARSREIVAGLTPEDRHQFARVRAIAAELKAGRIPRCVLARRPDQARAS